MQVEAQGSNGRIPVKTGRSGGSADTLEQRAGRAVQNWIDRVAPCPWTAHAGASRAHHHRAQKLDVKPARQNVYTPEQRRIRDESPWTLVQGLLAPVQFLVFLVSLALVVRYLGTGEGYAVATASVVVKTLVLYAIMITGAIWEKVVFGRYLFAPAFFWEDVFSSVVCGLHTLYVVMLVMGWGDAYAQMLVALAAYASYAVNAIQFLLKLRAARKQEEAMGLRGQAAEASA